MEIPIWSGQSAIIVGGGPSLIGFPWETLKDVPHIIAINAAFEHVPTAEIFFTKDARVIQRFGNTKSFKNFKGIKAASIHKDSLPDIEPWRDQLTVTVRTGRGAATSNSGLSALELAYDLGAAEIYLLGFDLRNDGRGDHYHKSYPAHWKIDKTTLEKYKKDFELAAERLKGSRIFNVINPDYESALTCFQKIPIDDFVLLSEVFLKPC